MKRQEFISEEQFEEKYTLVKNPFYTNPEDCPFGGCMFETYGEEKEYIQDLVLARLTNSEPKQVWTIIEGDDDTKLHYISGYHLVNRIGYLVTEELVKDEVEINVEVDVSTE